MKSFLLDVVAVIGAGQKTAPAPPASFYMRQSLPASGLGGLIIVFPYNETTPGKQSCSAEFRQLSAGLAPEPAQ